MGKRISKEGSPEKAPQMGLAEQIKNSAEERDRVTENILPPMLAGQSPREFVEKACKLAKIEPPKSKEPLAYYVFLLQRDVLGFHQADVYDGCDGKLGPITFHALIRKFSVLDPKPRQDVIQKSRDTRKKFVSKEGYSAPPETSSLNEGPWKKIDPSETVLIGDSLIHGGYGRSFYRGTGLFRRYVKEFFKGGRSIFTMRRRLERYCVPAKAYVIGAAANDIASKRRSVYRIEREFLRMIEIMKRKNPNAKIVLLTLHGDDFKGFTRRSGVIEKMHQLNRRLKYIADRDPNISLIDIRGEILNAESNGKKVLYRDRLHYNGRGSRAVARLLKDYLARGKHGRLTDYI